MKFFGGAPKERRRRRAEKRSSKTREWTASFSQSILRFSSVLSQRAENAVLDPWSLDICVWDAPDVCPKSLRNPSRYKGLRASGLWSENQGAPKTQIRRPRIQRPILGPLSLRVRLKLRWEKRKRTLQKHPFGRPFPRTTPSPRIF